MAHLQDILTRLSEDRTLGLLGPMRWMDNNRTAVLALVDAGMAAELAERTGISKAIILRWRRRLGRTEEGEPPEQHSDLSYWRGFAAAYKTAFETLAAARVG